MLSAAQEARLRVKIRNLERLASNPGTPEEGENAQRRIEEIKTRLEGAKRTQVRFNDQHVLTPDEIDAFRNRAWKSKKSGDDLRRGAAKMGKNKKPKKPEIHEDWPFGWTDRAPAKMRAEERWHDQGSMEANSVMVQWECPGCGKTVDFCLSPDLLNRLRGQRGGFKEWIRIRTGGSKNLLCNDCWTLWSEI